MIASGLLIATSGISAAVATPTPLLPMELHNDEQNLEEGTLILRTPGEDPYVVPKVDDAGLLPPTKGSDKVARAFYAQDFALSVQCALPGMTNHVIDKYPSTRDGIISFHCGNSEFGFNHIKKNHPEHEWHGIMGGKASWTAYLRYLQRSALKRPNLVRTQDRQKVCYTTPVELYRVIAGKPKYWKTVHPSIIISANNKKIITTVPSSRRSTC